MTLVTVARADIDQKHLNEEPCTHIYRPYSCLSKTTRTGLVWKICMHTDFVIIIIMINIINCESLLLPHHYVAKRQKKWLGSLRLIIIHICVNNFIIFSYNICRQRDQVYEVIFIYVRIYMNIILIIFFAYYKYVYIHSSRFIQKIWLYNVLPIFTRIQNHTLPYINKRNICLQTE